MGFIGWDLFGWLVRLGCAVLSWLEWLVGMVGFVFVWLVRLGEMGW